MKVEESLQGDQVREEIIVSSLFERERERKREKERERKDR